MSANLIYEVRYVVDENTSSNFETVLQEHIEEKLGLPGFVSADVYAGEQQQGQTEWIAQYTLNNQTDLDNYFSEHADGAKQHLIDQFGSLRLTGKVLSPAFTKSERTCDNCGLQANYQYCANCGQRHQTRVVSLWQLFKDLLGGLFNWDARVWRTLLPLLSKPGFLTAEYLSGKRAHYTPPLRLYLVLSIIFFFVSGYLTSGDKVMIDNNVFKVSTAESEDQSVKIEPDNQDMTVNVPGFMDQEAWEIRLEAFAEELNTFDGKQRFLEELFSQAPVLMLVLLPLMALVSWLLHLFSKRYFVEHLLMLVHFHAFVFCFSLMALMLSKLLSMTDLDSLAAWLKIYVMFLIVYYFYKMLRSTLPQSRVAALSRVSAYGFFYMMFATLLLTIASLVTVITF